MKVLLGWIYIVVVVASSVSAGAVTNSSSSSSSSSESKAASKAAAAAAVAEAEANAKTTSAAKAKAIEISPIKLRKRSPLKVFILCGQSNMQGHGYMNTKKEDDTASKFRNGTLEWMVDTYPDEYRKLKNNETNTTTTTTTTTGGEGNWKQRDDVWITYNRQSIGNVLQHINQYGKLIPGYGGDPGQEGHQMGPELGFGYELGDALNNNDKEDENNNILLIKIGWGGRSLAVDFRPPSSGGTTGLYYESVIESIYNTLKRLPQLFPEYQSLYGGSSDEGRTGYEISGFAWHQGWNDGCDTNMTKEYEYNLANLIRDIRIDLDTPDLPVSIGVSGMNGWQNKDYDSDSDENIYDTTREDIIAAQFAVGNETLYPEFSGTVLSVETRSFFRTPYDDPDDPDGQGHGQSPGNHVHHWNNNCESYWLIGSSMGKAMVELLKIQSLRNKFNIAFNN
jgi:hypothetical protein